MSAPLSHDPLVVNTKDGVCWTRRTVTSSGIALYAPEGVCGCPEFVMATLPELAEHGIVGSADVLPVPVGPQPQVDDDRAKAPWGRHEDGRPILGPGAHWTDVPELVDREVARIRGRVDEATSGHWYVASDIEAWRPAGTVRTNVDGYQRTVGRVTNMGSADVDLVLHAHDDVSWCLEMVAKFRTRVVELEHTVQQMVDALNGYDCPPPGEMPMEAVTRFAVRLMEAERLVAEVDALELGEVDGRVSAACGDPKHPTWLRKPDDLRGCPWCRIAELEAERHSTNEALDDAVQELRARPTEDPSGGFPPALPWLALLDEDDRVEFLDELADSAAVNQTSAVRLAEIERTCATYRLIAEAQHGHNTAPGPDAMSQAFAPVAALHEVLDGEHFATVHHDYRVPHDMPEGCRLSPEGLDEVSQYWFGGGTQ